ncbi:unnamed protein product, partial [Timema podura]|nr:unnamed protein product [Timema podura]
QDLSPEDGKLEKLMRGVSLWIMDWKHPDFLNLDTIINLLKEKTDVQDAQDRTGSGTVKGRGQKKKVKSLKKHSQDNVLSTPNKKERKSGGSIVEESSGEGETLEN